jgi:hypothetical protein
MQSAAFTISVGTRVLSLYMRDDGVRVDAVFVTRGSATNPATINLTGNGGAWSYATTPNTYQANTCNGADFDSDDTLPGNQDTILPTGKKPNCHALWAPGAGGGVFDLSGNLKEWTMQRVPGENPLRGGGVSSDAAGIQCVAAEVVVDDYRSAQAGFRCCR